MASLNGKKIAFLGTGNMAEALVRGLLASKQVTQQDVTCTVRRPERGEELSKRHGVATSTDNRAAARAADVIILSAKPQQLNRLLAEVADEISPQKLVISIAAGVPMAAMEKKLGKGVRLVRAMPNTPALVDAGATALARGEHATQEDLNAACVLFGCVGTVIEVEESLLDACSGLSGSGPAYIFLIIEALSDAGVKVGLSRRTSQTLAAQTVFGAAKLLIESGDHPASLKDMVTSPGGITIAGLHTLEAGGLRTTLMNAVEAATKRARELGAEFASRQ